MILYSSFGSISFLYERFFYLLPTWYGFDRAPHLFYEPIRFPPPVGVPTIQLCLQYNCTFGPTIQLCLQYKWPTVQLGLQYNCAYNTIGPTIQLGLQYNWICIPQNRNPAALWNDIASKQQQQKSIELLTAIKQPPLIPPKRMLALVTTDTNYKKFAK